MAKNTAPAATPCECGLFEALDPEQLTEENLANGDYDSFTTGCNATTKRTFAPGHDAKLKSFLIKHDALGHDIRRVEGGMAVSAEAISHATRYEFAHLVAAGIEKARAKAQARAARAAAKAAKPAKAERKLAEGAGLVTPTHDGNEARQAREAKTFAQLVAEEEAKHAAEQAASRPAPEWDDVPEGFVVVTEVQDSVVLAPADEAETVDLTDEPEVIAKVGRWDYRGIVKDGTFYYLAKDGHTNKETTAYTVVRTI